MKPCAARNWRCGSNLVQREPMGTLEKEIGRVVTLEKEIGRVGRGPKMMTS
jgi:hypothetical protein